MIPYFYYWQALRRLKSSEKTLKEFGHIIPPMIQAQHDMIALFPSFKKKFVLTGHPRIEILKEKNIMVY